MTKCHGVTFVDATDHSEADLLLFVNGVFITTLVIPLVIQSHRPEETWPLSVAGHCRVVTAWTSLPAKSLVKGEL